MRYLVFGGNCYHPAGGPDDFLGFAKDLDEAAGLIRKMEGLDVSWADGSWAVVCDDNMVPLERWTHPGGDRGWSQSQT